MPEKQQKQPQKTPLRYNLFVVIIFLLLLAVVLYSVWGCQNKNKEIKYSEAIKLIQTNQTSQDKIVTVRSVPQSIGSTAYTIYMYVESNSVVYIFIAANETELANVTTTISNADESISYYTELKSSFPWFQIIFYGGLIAFSIFILYRISRSSAARDNSAFEFSKSRARLSRNKSTTFKDVAGLDEEKQEVEEIVDFLKNPKKYLELGARIPKGILLYGQPGTGKTLLARAIAGEAGVPFYFISGSDLVEMFVGVGASRVRDMFKTAKQNSPCILFIDEIDAVGRQRGTGLGGGHDEREQTLNQLLVEMDGFGTNTGVIVMAATNRSDILDPALLRPGRFDRQIYVNAPDLNGREAILKVHARNKKINSSISFKEIARRTSGFTGADIENLMNEAALLVARRNGSQIELGDIDEAIDRVMMGPAKKSRVISLKEKERIAHHEAGHAVIGSLVENAQVVEKVTIIPRGKAGGYNLMMPESDDERFNRSRTEYLDIITGYLGGRVAEELVYNEITDGAYDDIKRATKIARLMVTELGMSSLGPISYESNEDEVFLGRDFNKRSISDDLASEIDNEVRKIINECYEKAKDILSKHVDLLHAIAKYLVEAETLYREDIDEIVKTGKLSRLEKTEQVQEELPKEDSPKEENTTE